MENKFIPYELALKLKNLGFNEECVGVFPFGKKTVLLKMMPNQEEADMYFGGILAPIWQDAFDWFTKKGLYYSILPNLKHMIKYIKSYNPELTVEPLFRYDIYNDFNPCFDMRFETYEEARLGCLEKMIELIS